MSKAQRDIRRKKRILEHAARIGNKTCRYFGIARSGFYVWKKAYEAQGDSGLINKKPCPHNPRLRTPPETSRRSCCISAKPITLAPSASSGISSGHCQLKEYGPG